VGGTLSRRHLPSLLRFCSLMLPIRFPHLPPLYFSPITACLARPEYPSLPIVMTSPCPGFPRSSSYSFDSFSLSRTSFLGKLMVNQNFLLPLPLLSFLVWCPFLTSSSSTCDAFWKLSPCRHAPPLTILLFFPPPHFFVLFLGFSAHFYTSVSGGRCRLHFSFVNSEPFEKLWFLVIRPPFLVLSFFLPSKFYAPARASLTSHPVPLSLAAPFLASNKFPLWGAVSFVSTSAVFRPHLTPPLPKRISPAFAHRETLTPSCILFSGHRFPFPPCSEVREVHFLWVAKEVYVPDILPLSFFSSHAFLFNFLRDLGQS